jgi:hypothetical protein
MRIDAYARETHHADHILPVWKAIKARNRGTFFVSSDKVADHLAKRDAPSVKVGVLGPGPVPILTSASASMTRAYRAERTNIAIMEHGAGQSFGGGRGVMSQQARTSSSYAGGRGRHAGLFLHPGPHPAARDRAAYPKARVEIVGCPKLDTLPHREGDPAPTVAFSFHWDMTMVPEGRSTFILYRDAVARFARAHPSVHVLGHGHPRIMERLAGWYRRQDIEIVWDFEDVCRRADVYVCDGMSTLYEFASTGRPVVVLNAPYYRKHIEHGLRFWAAANVGEQVDTQRDLDGAIKRALADPKHGIEAREAALDMVYAYRTGAGERAARVLESWAREVG